MCYTPAQAGGEALPLLLLVESVGPTTVRPCVAADSRLAYKPCPIFLPSTTAYSRDQDQIDRGINPSVRPSHVRLLDRPFPEQSFFFAGNLCTLICRDSQASLI